MLSGQPYRADDPELVVARNECQHLLAEFNAGEPAVLQGLLGSLGKGSEILPRFLCDYGAQITVGANSFVNYDAIFLDCARITIGDNVQIGPRTQLLTAIHPVGDVSARRAGWESALPIVVGDNVWLAANVLVCAGVAIGDNAVIGAGSVVLNDIPAGVLAAGNPCRIIRRLAD
jgi:maltose O-acetyltransferase